MRCPKCGYMRQTRDDAFVPATECPSCGIVYSKHDTIAAPTSSSTSAIKHPPLRPSAVDPESLRKARERVEKRLRERMETRSRDDRYEQTIELAKKITNGSIHDGQDPVLQALEQKMADTPMDPIDDPDVDTQDPVLLEEMVGVQLHSGKNTDNSREDGKNRAGENQSLDPPLAETPPDQDEISEAVKRQETEAAQVDARAPGGEPDTVEGDGEETESLPAEASETEAAQLEPEVVDPAPETAHSQPQVAQDQGPNDNDYPDDVRVETVVLTSELVTTDAPLQADFAAEQPAEETASEDEDIELPEAYIAEASNATRFGANLTRLLPMVAWLILITGVVGAVLSWTTISEVEAGINIPASDQRGTVLPLGLLLGFAYLATGALGFAFFWVSSMINRQLKDIRHILLTGPGSSGTHMPEGNLTE